MANLTLGVKAVIKSELDFREVSDTKLYIDSFRDDVMKKSCGSLDWYEGKSVEIFEHFEQGADEYCQEYFLMFEFEAKKYKAGFNTEEEQKVAFQKILEFDSFFCGVSVELHKGCGALAVIKHKVKNFYGGEEFGESEGSVAFIDKDGTIWNQNKCFFSKETLENIRDIFLLKTGQIYYKMAVK
jgi:hypothetical protein